MLFELPISGNIVDMELIHFVCSIPTEDGYYDVTFVTSTSMRYMYLCKKDLDQLIKYLKRR